MRPSRLLLVLVAPLAFIACLSGSESLVVPQGPDIDCATLATNLTAAEPTLTTTASGLKYRDVSVGTGATVNNGQKVAVNYAGCLTSGVKFDQLSVQNPNDALKFTVGADSVIKGVDEGVVGMKVGGRRQLVIPPSLGYGTSGAGAIPPNSTLVFTIDVLATQ